MIIQNIIDDNEEIVGNNLFFVEKDAHLSLFYKKSSLIEIVN